MSIETSRKIIRVGKRGFSMDKKAALIKALKGFAEEVSSDIPINKMYLFGSRATGKIKKNSDVDLLLVSKGFIGKRRLRRAPQLYMKWNLDYPVDFICLTPKEFREKKMKQALFKKQLGKE